MPKPVYILGFIENKFADGFLYFYIKYEYRYDHSKL